MYVIISMTWFLWYFYFHNFGIDNILIDKKSHQNILTNDISYKTLIDRKLLQIRFDKIDRFIRIYVGTRYLTLFGSKKYDTIYNRIRYVISLKGSITYIFYHYYAKIKVDSYHFLPIEKRSSLFNIIILINSVLNKDKNCYYYNIIFEKCSYQLAKKSYKTFVHSIIMLRFAEAKVTKETFYGAKNL